MKCSNCGAELADGAKFCGECGTKVVKATFCPECGAKCAPGVKFCSECGHKLGGGVAEEARPKVANKLSSKYIDKNCFSMRQFELCKNIDDEVVEKLQQAAQNGDADAFYVLGWCCLVKEEEEKSSALKGFQIGAEQGSDYCRFAIARNLWSGEGECDQAIEMYEKAAQTVGVPAYWEIAMIIMEGYVDRPWQDALPYFQKIVEMKDRADWDPFLTNAATGLSQLLPKVANGDADAVGKLYRLFADFEVENMKYGRDAWFGFGIRSITFGSSLGRILSTYEESVDGDDECIDDAVQALLKHHDDKHWGEDIEEASDEGSVVAERALNWEEPSAGDKQTSKSADDDDDEDEMLDEEDEE